MNNNKQYKNPKLSDLNECYLFIKNIPILKKKYIYKPYVNKLLIRVDDDGLCKTFDVK